MNYADGHRDTLSVDAAKRLVETDKSTNTYLHNPNAYGSYHHNGLANVLLWGSLGICSAAIHQEIIVTTNAGTDRVSTQIQAFIAGHQL